MITKIFLILLGIILISYSLFFIIIYLNLLNMGYNIYEYIKYIFTNIECLFIFVGILIIYLTLRRKKNEIYK